MTESYLTDSELNALSGTSDFEQEVAFPTIYESPYYTSFYKMLYRLLDVARRAGDLRVFKDGDLTFGVRAGRYLNGDTAVNYAGVSEQSLTNNATNYIYLTAAGVLTVNTTGFPTASATPHLPLATIVTAAGVYDHDDITDYRGRTMLTVCSGLTAADMAEAAAFFQATNITGTEAETLSDGSDADALHLHPTKADKVAAPTAGNFAALDANGNLADSGHKDSDYEDAGTMTTHESTYDHTDLPSATEKDALEGTSGTPSVGNPYVTNTDSRNTNERTPTDSSVTVAKLAAALQDLIPTIVLTGTDDADGTGTMAIQVKDVAGNNLAKEIFMRVWIADADKSEPDPQTVFSVLTGEQMREVEADADYEVITNSSGYANMNIDTATNKTVYVMATIDGIVYSGSVAITGNP
ncbi:MAG: hypothetical protein K8S55_03190 [Phycisphaerae bacterium]|nr:hypothetical protein [Phycisphaerae bacterium]